MSAQKQKRNLYPLHVVVGFAIIAVLVATIIVYKFARLARMR